MSIEILGSILNYIKFTNTTAIYTHGKYYVLLGLVGELGELVEKSGITSPLLSQFIRLAKVCEFQKKMLRDGFNAENLIRAKDLLKEVMLACGFTYDYFEHSLLVKPDKGDIFIYEEKEPHELFTIEIGDLFWYIAQMLVRFGIEDISDILKANYDKLTSRLARDKIRGSGDLR